MRNGNERRETERGTGDRREDIDIFALSRAMVANAERIAALLAFSGRYDTLATVADANQEEANRLREENTFLLSLLSC